MQRSFFQNENRHRLIEYDLYESCLKRQLFYTKWCWAVIASALSGQNERSYPNDRKKSVFFLSTDGAVSQNSSRPCRTLERGADNFLMFGRGRRSDRITLGEPLGRAHGTLQPVWMKVS